MVFESTVIHKWQLDSMYEHVCQGDIFPRPWFDKTGRLYALPIVIKTRTMSYKSYFLKPFISNSTPSALTLYSYILFLYIIKIRQYYNINIIMFSYPSFWSDPFGLTYKWCGLPKTTSIHTANANSKCIPFNIPLKLTGIKILQHRGL
jgi:hypothetical protein